MVQPFPRQSACRTISERYRAGIAPMAVNLPAGIPSYLFTAAGRKLSLKALAQRSNQQCSHQGNKPGREAGSRLAFDNNLMHQPGQQSHLSDGCQPDQYAGHYRGANPPLVFPGEPGKPLANVSLGRFRHSVVPLTSTDLAAEYPVGPGGVSQHDGDNE